MVRTASEPNIKELATLLARGYLRLVTSGRQNSRIAPNSALRESASGSPNCLDVGPQRSDELEPEGRP